MNTKKALISDVAILVSVILAAGLVFGVARFTSYEITKAKNVPVFQYAEEISISPNIAQNSISKVMSFPKVIEQTLPKVAVAEKATLTLPIIPPRVLLSVLPQYPEAALREGTQGTVLLSLFVGSDGKVGRAEIAKTSGNSELDSSAAEAGKKWTFEPAKYGAGAIEARFEIPVKFVIQ
ncbi:MAG: energy transducer TonB [Candidatus Saganbacteria bacterium]|nr:energy transducer TonB [Candidatus Saganbacteria bacterium]